MKLKRFYLYIKSISLVAAFLWSAALSQDLNTILNHYQQGDFKTASNELDSYLRYNPLDFEALYLAGKLETNSKNSIGYFRRIWESSSRIKKEESGLELCLYYRSAGVSDSLIQLCSEFKNAFPQSHLLPQILWLESLAYLSSGNTNKALKELESIIEVYPYSSWAAWARLGLGDVFFSQGDFKRSLDEYKKVIDLYAETDVLPLALIGIYRVFQSSGEKDKAILYMNLYREKFPHGMDAESEIIFQEFDEGRDPGKAEKYTGTKYTIQIGVFGKKENADRMIEKLKSRGYIPEKLYKNIDNKRYYVVRVGSFDSISEAQKIREKLEREEGEVFRIVIK